MDLVNDPKLNEHCSAELIVASTSDSYSGVPQQNWYYTDDNHIAVTGGRACADVKREDGTTFQTWDCSGNDPQQVNQIPLTQALDMALLTLTQVFTTSAQT